MSFIWREPVKTTVQSDDFLPLTIPEPTVAIEDAKFQCEAKKAVVSSRLEAEVKRLGKEQRDEVGDLFVLEFAALLLFTDRRVERGCACERVQKLSVCVR